MRYVVGVYMQDRAYGGPEEGGWWYEVGELIRTMRVFTNEDKACQYCRRLNTLLNATINRGRREISSALSERRYGAEVHDNVLPPYYPSARPYYE